MPISNLPYLIALAHTSSTVLNNNGYSGHPFIVPDLSGNISRIFSLNTVMSLGLQYIYLITLRKYPSVPIFVSESMLSLPF